MTQQPQSPYNPGPYSQPGYGSTYPYNPAMSYAYGYGDPMQNLLAPARRAMWLMMVLGVIVLLFGGCMTLLGSMWDEVMKQAPAETRAQLDQLQSRAQGISIPAIMLGFGIGAVVLAILHLVAGLMVRRGTLGPVIMGILLTGVMLLCSIFIALSNVAQTNLGGVCMGIGGLAMWGLLLIWLIQAASRAGQVAAMRGSAYTSPHTGQYWQYQQPQPPAPGYGYPQPSAPPPPPPPGQNPPQM